MKIIFTIIISGCLNLFGQSDSTLFDNTFKFKDGVYRTYKELLKNEPKYLNYRIDAKADGLFGKITFVIYDQMLNMQPFEDSVFAYVNNGTLAIFYMNHFYKLILKGTISTFYIETINVYSSGYTTKDDKLFFVDLMTGTIDKLNPSNINEFIKRDNELYSTYSTASESKIRKTLYSFILKYNQRNPLYIRTK
jgi:hypothetical protein